MSESDVLAALRRGDGDAYESVVREHTPRLLAVARRLLRNEEDARDAVQEGFLSAFRAIGSFAGDAKLSTWLHRIVVNAGLMKMRTRRRKPERSIEELLPEYLDDGHQKEPPQRWRDCPVETKEMQELVRNLIDELPENHRNVLLLRDIEEVDTEETARILGLTAGAVKTRLHRARQALRTLLNPHFAEGGS